MVMLCPYGDIDFEDEVKPEPVKVRQWYRCPKCGNKLELQPGMRKMRISGSINLKCGAKLSGKRACVGVVIIKPKG